MQSVHTFVTAFAQSMSGVLFKLAAFGALNTRRSVSKTILTDVACFAKPAGAWQFQLSAIGTDYLCRFMGRMVSLFIALFTKPFRINRPLFPASETFKSDFRFPSFHCHRLSDYFTKKDSLCQ